MKPDDSRRKLLSKSPGDAVRVSRVSFHSSPEGGGNGHRKLLVSHPQTLKEKK